MGEIGNPCTETQACTLPNIYCQHPNCTFGKQQEAARQAAKQSEAIAALQPGVLTADDVDGSPDQRLLRAPAPVAVTDELSELKEALDSRCLYVNPQILRAIADEIDCDGQCEFIWREWDTNAGGCHKSERGEYCPNDLAETLRSVAKVAEKFAALQAGRK